MKKDFFILTLLLFDNYNIHLLTSVYNLYLFK